MSQPLVRPAGRKEKRRGATLLTALAGSLAFHLVVLGVLARWGKPPAPPAERLTEIDLRLLPAPKTEIVKHAPLKKPPEKKVPVKKAVVKKSTIKRHQVVVRQPVHRPRVKLRFRPIKKAAKPPAPKPVKTTKRSLPPKPEKVKTLPPPKLPKTPPPVTPEKQPNLLTPGSTSTERQEQEHVVRSEEPPHARTHGLSPRLSGDKARKPDRPARVEEAGNETGNERLARLPRNTASSRPREDSGESPTGHAQQTARDDSSASTSSPLPRGERFGRRESNESEIGTRGTELSHTHRPDLLSDAGTALSRTPSEESAGGGSGAATHLTRSSSGAARNSSQGGERIFAYKDSTGKDRDQIRIAESSGPGTGGGTGRGASGEGIFGIERNGSGSRGHGGLGSGHGEGAGVGNGHGHGAGGEVAGGSGGGLTRGRFAGSGGGGRGRGNGAPFGSPHGGKENGSGGGSSGGGNGGPGGSGHDIRLARGDGGDGAAPGGAGRGRGGLGSGFGNGRNKGRGSGAGSGRSGEDDTGAGSGGGARRGGRLKIEGTSGKRKGEGGSIIGRGIWAPGLVGRFYQDSAQHPDTPDATFGPGHAIDWKTFTDSRFQKTSQTIDFDWGTNPPGPGMKSTFWSARWTGKIFVPKDDIYEFFFDQLDDGGRLILDGDEIINVWKVQKSTPSSGKIPLKRGPHSIEIEYVQGPATAASIKLTWRSTSFPKEVVGLYRPGD
jgi:hypothetical protein